MLRPFGRISSFFVLFSFSCLILKGQGPSPSALTVRPEPPPDAKAIVRRGLEADERNYQLARDYTFERRQELKLLDKKGKPKKDEINTYDVTILYDEPYERRIRKDDKPLTGKEEKKEEDKLQKFTSEREHESANEHTKRLAKFEKERKEERAFASDVLNAYDFKLVGEDQLDGHDVYVVEANPRKDFHPTQPHADILSKLRGKVWIDQKDYGWVKVQAETLDTISWGLFILRIHKGTQMEFKEVRINDEIWLPSQIQLNGAARFALVAGGNFDLDMTFSNYKKFTSGARILPGVTEAQPTANCLP